MERSANFFRKTGSSSSVLALTAINASADLLFISAKSVFDKSSTLNGWQAFEEKWLKISDRADK
ncbi:MAG: hypothetical protein COB04_14390 [Gammaproteobacteria bacterium]|nr:MAG: hypothetical protein COB04_14390 [Gammaproteobacteria bacterium]